MKLDFAFGLCMCTRGAGLFKSGKCYPLVGFNNGLHIAYADKAGNALYKTVHNYGDELIDPEDQCSDGPEYPIFKYLNEKYNEEAKTMSEKRGYPHPDYTEEDILTGETELMAEVGLVTVEADHYEELVSKAAALDILTADIKRKLDYGYSYNLVNDDLVMAVTGMNTYQAKKNAEEAAKKAAEEEQDGQD